MIAVIAGIIIASYLIGSIPFGWIIVKIATGRDIRGIESGRTGGTNVWRAAGLLAGLAVTCEVVALTSPGTNSTFAC